MEMDTDMNVDVDSDADADADAGKETTEDILMVSVSDTQPRTTPCVPPPIQLPLVVEESPVVYCGVRLLTSEYDQHLYGIPPPSCFHARTIWFQAGLPMRALGRWLEVKLVDWAYTYALVDIQAEEIRSVRYQASGNCLYFCSWRVFLRWMMCACIMSVGS